ncbi:MAG: hypothetical protein NVSMB56_08470 [Pyrinomonadaceae bacterium]
MTATRDLDGGTAFVGLALTSEPGLTNGFTLTGETGLTEFGDGLTVFEGFACLTAGLEFILCEGDFLAEAGFDLADLVFVAIFGLVCKAFLVFDTDFEGVPLADVARFALGLAVDFLRKVRVLAEEIEDMVRCVEIFFSTLPTGFPMPDPSLRQILSSKNYSSAGKIT